MVRPFDNTNQGMLIYQLLVWNAQGALAVTTLHISGSLITQPKAVSSTKIFIKICHPPPLLTYAMTVTLLPYISPSRLSVKP